MDGLKRELQCRSRILSIFNKRVDEFPSKREFDDYLEEREDIIFKLTEGIETAATEAKIAEYKRKNKKSIDENRIRQIEQQRAALDVGKAQVSGTLYGENAVEGANNDMSYKPVPAGGMVAVNGVVGNAMPHPLREVALNSEGTLIHGSLPSTAQEWNTMAKAAGWTREMYTKCAVNHAFSTVFV